jgi:hypothetical protein
VGLRALATACGLVLAFQISLARAQASPADEAARAEAEKHFQLALELGNAKQDWAGAYRELLESRRLFPTRSATRNAAFALTKLGRYVEALEMYDTLLREFASTSPPEQLRAYQAERRAALARVGELELGVNTPGATVVLDGEQRGVTPLAGPLRVESGVHIVRLSKDGFASLERQVAVRGGQRKLLELELKPQLGTGILEISAKNGAVFDVVIDGAVVGATPWRGNIPTGLHSVLLRNEGHGSLPVAVDVAARRTSKLELPTVVLDAAARIVPSPASGTIFIDGVFVGNGTWTGALPKGKHRFEVVAPGYMPFRRDVRLEPGGSKTVFAKLNQEAPLLGFFVEPVLGIVAGRSLRGGSDDACDCDSRSRPFGWMAALRAGYSLLPQLAIELNAGYLRVSESSVRQVTTIDGETSSFTSSNLDDRVSLKGPLAAVSASTRFFERTPLTLRLSAGVAWLNAELSNHGTFASRSQGISGPLSIDEPDQLLVTPFAATELRFGYRFTRHLSADLGASLMLLAPASAERHARSGLLDIASLPRRQAGVLTLPDEPVARPFLLVSPSIAARVEW